MFLDIVFWDFFLNSYVCGYKWAEIIIIFIHHRLHYPRQAQPDLLLCLVFLEFSTLLIMNRFLLLKSLLSFSLSRLKRCRRLFNFHIDQKRSKNHFHCRPKNREIHYIKNAWCMKSSMFPLKSLCGGSDPLWQLLHYLSPWIMNITTALNIPVRYQIEKCEEFIWGKKGDYSFLFV